MINFVSSSNSLKSCVKIYCGGLGLRISKNCVIFNFTSVLVVLSVIRQTKRHNIFLWVTGTHNKHQIKTKIDNLYT